MIHSFATTAAGTYRSAPTWDRSSLAWEGWVC
jgi:hypothetical protein